jgi:hypothetical protein
MEGILTIGQPDEFFDFRMIIYIEYVKWKITLEATQQKGNCHIGRHIAHIWKLCLLVACLNLRWRKNIILL